MKAIAKLGKVVLGEGLPKIAVPIVGRKRTDILESAREIQKSNPDVVEWRIDFFDDVTDAKSLQTVGQELKKGLGDIALLTTFRTDKEGGNLPLSEKEYFKVCDSVLAGRFTDGLDVERFHDENSVKRMVSTAHDQKVLVVMSNHDFDKTPDQSEIINRLVKMEKIGADVAKIAVTPNSVDDVLTLLSATNIARAVLNIPVITMSMGNLGKISRVSGDIFGSCLSFATVQEASAPGQIKLESVRQIQNELKVD